MTNLVKIRGLSRGPSYTYNATTASGILSGGSGPASLRGFRVKSAVGRHYLKNTDSVKAAITSGTVTFTSAYPGTYANNFKAAIVVSGNNTPLSVVVTNTSATAYPVITVNAATNGSGTAISTAKDVVNAVNSDPVASQFVTAAVGGGAQAGGAATASSTAYAFSAALFTGGSNGTGSDAEPGPQTLGVAGEPIFINLNNKVTVVVDTDDQNVARTLMRNRWRWVEIGAA